MATTSMSYWRWFFLGSGGRAGFRRLVNLWLVMHVAVGAGLAWLVDVDLQTAGSAVLLPLAGIFIGLAFAWGGNAQALLQTAEMEEMAEHHEGGLAEYVFTYQTAILVILVTLVLWGLAGLKVFDGVWPTPQNSKAYLVVKGALFAMCSLTLRECWHVVLGAQWMLLARQEIKKARKSKGGRGDSDKAGSGKS